MKLYRAKTSSQLDNSRDLICNSVSWIIGFNIELDWCYSDDASDSELKRIQRFMKKPKHFIIICMDSPLIQKSCASMNDVVLSARKPFSVKLEFLTKLVNNSCCHPIIFDMCPNQFIIILYHMHTISYIHVYTVIATGIRHIVMVVH